MPVTTTQPDPGPDRDPDPGPGPGPGPGPAPGNPRQTTFGAREAERLLWRAGFGPRPGDVAAAVGRGLEGAVHALTRPATAEAVEGAGPVDAFGAPYNRQRAVGEYGGNDIWWFDRMVRSNQPLRQRMTLLWQTGSRRPTAA